MERLEPAAIAALLRPYWPEPLDPLALERLAIYLELLLRWNTRTNLTSIREPERIVQRHFGESLFLARQLPAAQTLLDFGSGGGFPGIPLQVVRPGLHVLLAESQGKKAAFLRQAVRACGLHAEVWPKRVEALPAGRTFDVVTMRAVDRMERMVPVAAERVGAGGILAMFRGKESVPLRLDENFNLASMDVPGSDGTILLATRRVFHVEQE